MLPSPHPAVVCKPVSEGAVLLHTESEVYFGLNEVGREVWSLLPPTCKDLAQICDALGDKYPDADPAALKQDVSDLIEHMVQEGLLVVTA